MNQILYYSQLATSIILIILISIIKSKIELVDEYRSSQMCFFDPFKERRPEKLLVKQVPKQSAFLNYAKDDNSKIVSQQQKISIEKKKLIIGNKEFGADFWRKYKKHQDMIIEQIKQLKKQ